MSKKKGKKSLIKEIIIIIVFIIITLIAKIMIIASDSEGKKLQYMNKLNYDVVVNADGSMTVSETWDVLIYRTNTLFKNFEKSSRFGEIKDVTVKDLETNQNLTKIDVEMYHVTDNCYYALDISGNKFEIAWGTGMEERLGYKKYLVTYTVTDVVTNYLDCQELYWQFLSNSNAIPVEKVTGTIKFPKGMTDISKLKAWGHGPLNGKIEISDASTVKFEVDDLSKERMLEIRVIETGIFANEVSPNKVKLYNNLSNILDEEDKWAKEVNEKAEKFNRYKLIVLIIYGVILLNVVRKIIKINNIKCRQNDGIRHLDIEYYRDIPRENDATPGEAMYLYHFTKEDNFKTTYQSDTVAATILNLTLKKYLRLECDKDSVYIKILKDDTGLKEDEKQVYILLKEAGADIDGFEIGNLQTYAKKEYYKYSRYIDRLVNYSRTSLYNLGLVDKGQRELYNKSKSAESSFIILSRFAKYLIISALTYFIPFIKSNIGMTSLGVNFVNNYTTIVLFALPYIGLKLIQLKITRKIQPKISILTQEGSEEKEKWVALGNFLENYSLINEKDVPSLAVWEKYLVFATAFGIADKVIEQMKAKYPEVFVKEYWEDEEKTNLYPILNFTTYNQIYSVGSTHSSIGSLQSMATSAYNTSLREISRHASSSGSGGGGGFSSGGGGRRWRWPEWEADKL